MQGAYIESTNYQLKSAPVLARPQAKPHSNFLFLATTSIKKCTSSRRAHEKFIFQSSLDVKQDLTASKASTAQLKVSAAFSNF